MKEGEAEAVGLIHAWDHATTCTNELLDKLAQLKVLTPESLLDYCTSVRKVIARLSEQMKSIKALQVRTNGWFRFWFVATQSLHVLPALMR